MDRMPNYTNNAYSGGDNSDAWTNDQPFGMWNPNTATNTTASQNETYTEQSVNNVGQPYMQYGQIPGSNTDSRSNYGATAPDNMYKHQGMGQNWQSNQYFPPQSVYGNQPEFYSPHQGYNSSVTPVQENNTEAISQGSGYRRPGDGYFYSNTSAAAFKNPLLGGEEDSDKPENLIQQLHITTEKDAKNTEKRTPSFISKASLAVLKNDLNEAALVFKSPANLKIARDSHLGFDVTKDISDTVVLSNLSVFANEFTPKKKSPRTATEADEEELMMILNDFISNILTQPGEFDELSFNLISYAKNYSYSNQTLEKVVQLLFTTAIEEENFKYLGAKLCSKLADPTVIPSFRNCFLKHLQAEYKKNLALLEKEHSDLEAIHGFCMFLGEVYIQIKINGQPLKALGRSISKMTDLLLKSGNLSHIKFSCKLLKLTSGFLFDAFKDSKEDMEKHDQNFEFLRKFVEKHSDGADEKSKELIPLVQSVLNVRSNQENSERRTKSPEYEPSLSDSNYYMNEPVFFTPDGVQYTAADAQVPEFYDKYLSKHSIPRYVPTEDNQNAWSTDNTDLDDFVPSDEELDILSDFTQAEYDDDFEKFLLESGQI